MKDVSIQKVMVVGSGAAGSSAALTLAKFGCQVYLVEKEEQLGGWAASYGCQTSQECQACSVCLLSDILPELPKQPNVSLLTKTQISSLEGSLGHFQVTLRQNGEPQERKLEVSAFVIATGFQPFDAKLKGEYGYGRYPNVITGLDAQQMLHTEGKILKPNGELPQRVAFIQCVGSRDFNIGNPYCSRICCAYALRLAAFLRTQSPECSVTIFYMDLQPWGKKFHQLLEALTQDQNVRFIVSMPSKIFGWPEREDLEIRYVDPIEGELRAESFDLVILSIGMSPPPQVEAIASLLNLKTNDDGFLFAGENGEGIFLAGACQGPRSIEESMGEGRAAALAAVEFLKKT